MKFTVSTKALCDALSTGVVVNNISSFYAKSQILQISCDTENLRINLETENIMSEITVHGKGEWDNSDKTGDAFPSYITRFVDTILFKKLASTFESDTLDITFTDGGMYIYSDQSKFVIPQVVDNADAELARPHQVDSNVDMRPLNIDDWQFIKNNQMFAVAKSFIRPIYTYVYFNDQSDVLVGDLDNSLFTHSTHNDINDNCLLNDAIINVLAKLPTNSAIGKVDDNYIIECKTDDYIYLSEFIPRHEDIEDANLGVYNAQIFLDMMKKPESEFIRFNVQAVNKFLTQVSLIAANYEDIVTIKTENGEFDMITGSDSKSLFNTTGSCPDFELKFRLSSLKSILANYTVDELSMCPVANDEGEIAGILVWDDELTTLLAGIE